MSLNQRASLVIQMGKNPPAMEEMKVQSLGQEDSLEKDTHSSVLTWRIHRQRSLVGYSTWGHQESDTTEQLTLLNRKSF